MNCIKCGEPTRVSTTYQNDNNSTRRRRICLVCDFRFTTREFPEQKDIEKAESEKKEKPKKETKKVDSLSQAWYNR